MECLAVIDLRIKPLVKLQRWLGGLDTVLKIRQDVGNCETDFNPDTKGVIYLQEYDIASFTSM